MKNALVALLLPLAFAGCGTTSTGDEPFHLEDFPATGVGCAYSRPGKKGTAVYQSRADFYIMRINGQEIAVRFNPETSEEEGGGYRVGLLVADDAETEGGGKGRLTVTEIATGKEVVIEVDQKCEM